MVQVCGLAGGILDEGGSLEAVAVAVFETGKRFDIVNMAAVFEIDTAAGHHCSLVVVIFVEIGIALKTMDMAPAGQGDGFPGDSGYSVIMPVIESGAKQEFVNMPVRIGSVHCHRPPCCCLLVIYSQYGKNAAWLTLPVKPSYGDVWLLMGRKRVDRRNELWKSNRWRHPILDQAAMEKR
jgi:hypothetical protein